MKFNVGDEVYWTDPDEGVCSGYGIVKDVTPFKNGEIYCLKMKDGGELDALEEELS